jgi:serine/threonine protein kinase
MSAPFASDSMQALPVGTQLGEFEIVGLVGVGGFGIVYEADDHVLQRRVALKEYMPASLALRVGPLEVAMKSERARDTFDAGRRSFINEARLLAQFDHPSLIKVYRFWEANGTAYMVMPLYRGPTLRNALAEGRVVSSEPWLRALLLPLLDALEHLHRANCFHRDIAPDNILLLDDGRPLLLDFGAARRVIGDATQDLTVILKPGFAPIEQYANGPETKQGPWTDIYALASVVYYCATGRTPVASVSRIMSDTLAPLGQVAGDRLSPEFCAAIDRAMAVRIEDRTASVADLRHDLGSAEGVASTLFVPASPRGGSPIPTHYGGGVPASTRQVGAEPSDPLGLGVSRGASPRFGTATRQFDNLPASFGGIADRGQSPAGAGMSRPASGAGPAAFGATSVLGPASRAAGSAGHGPPRSERPDGGRQSEEPRARPVGRERHQRQEARDDADGDPDYGSHQAPRRRHGRDHGDGNTRVVPWLVIAVILLSITAGIAWVLWSSMTVSPDLDASVPAPDARSTSADANPAGVPGEGRSLPGPAGTERSGTVTPGPAGTGPATTSPSAGDGPLVEVPPPDPEPRPGPTAPTYSGKDVLDAIGGLADPAINVSVSLERRRLKIDRDALQFKVKASEPGYLYLLMSGTRGNDLYLLFPNTADRANRLKAGVEMSLPRKGWEMVFEGPPGTDHFIAIVSPHERDFGELGLRAAEPFREFAPEGAAAQFASRGGKAFIGRARNCPGGETCDRFGVARFEIEEVR